MSDSDPEPKDPSYELPIRGYSEETAANRTYQFRNNRSGARTNRPQAHDHDILSGLPIAQWQQVPTLVGAPLKKDKPDAEPSIFEREHLMPKDSHMYSEHSQLLLRVARMNSMMRDKFFGQMKKNTEEDNDIDAEGDEENPEEGKGFTAKVWKKVPQHQEHEPPEYLAKRRKGLPPLYGANAGILPTAAAPPTRKAKIKKTDADGTSTVYEVLVPVGQTIEGEITEEAASVEMAEAPAPGTVIQGVGVVNQEGVVETGEASVQPTPTRPRPPPPKRKAKGPGRGRKKKVMITPGEGKGIITDEMNDTAGAEGSNANGTTADKGKDVDMSGIDPPNVGDDSMPQDGEKDDEDASESGEDEDSGDEGQSQLPSKEELTITTTTIELPAKPPTPIDQMSNLPDLPPPSLDQQTKTPIVGAAVVTDSEPKVETETKNEDAFLDEKDVINEVAEEARPVTENVVKDLTEEMKLDVPQHTSFTVPAAFPNTTLPEDHSVTNGLAEPLSAEEQGVSKGEGVYFEGDAEEVDLLGTLEKDLGGEEVGVEEVK